MQTWRLSIVGQEIDRLLPRDQFVTVVDWERRLAKLEEEPSECTALGVSEDLRQKQLDERYLELVPILEITKVTGLAAAEVKWTKRLEPYDGEIKLNGTTILVEVSLAWPDTQYDDGKREGEYGKIRVLEDNHRREHSHGVLISPETAERMKPDPNFSNAKRRKHRKAWFKEAQRFPETEPEDINRTIGFIHQSVLKKVEKNNPEYHGAWLGVVVTAFYVDDRFIRLLEAADCWKLRFKQIFRILHRSAACSSLWQRQMPAEQSIAGLRTSS
jgi:hypothetical protein